MGYNLEQSTDYVNSEEYQRKVQMAKEERPTNKTEWQDANKNTLGLIQWGEEQTVFDLLRKANIARDAEWNPNKILSLSFRGNELGGEIGEAQNILKKLERERLGLIGSRATVEQLAEELADGHICLDLIAMEFNIPTWDAIRQKFNKTSRERGLKVML